MSTIGRQTHESIVCKRQSDIGDTVIDTAFSYSNVPAVGRQVLAVDVGKVKVHLISLGQSTNICMAQKVGHGYL